MNSESHLAISADPPLMNPPVPPSGNMEMVPIPSVGVGQHTLHGAVTPFEWVLLGITVAVFVIGLFVIVRLIAKRYVATAGATSLFLSIALFVLGNLLPGFFYRTSLRNPVNDVTGVMIATAVPVFFVVGITLLFYGVYRIEKRVHAQQ